jgi:uncharacterized membrane protein YcaP (DUF421 family)
MRKSRVDMDGILQAARQQGPQRLDRIEYAVLETDAGISIIPKQSWELRRRAEKQSAPGRLPLGPI